MRTTSRWPWATRRRISASTASAGRLRDAPRTSGITQKRHENEQPSCTLTNARTRSSLASACTQPIAPTSPATNSGVSSLRRATTTTFAGQAGEGLAREVRSAACDVDAPVRPCGAGRLLARLRHRFVGHAARVHDGHVGVAVALVVPVGEQSLAHRVRVDVRDLAAEKADGERRHGRNSSRSAAQPSRTRRSSRCQPSTRGSSRSR